MNLFLLTDDFKIRAMVHLEIVFLEVWKYGYSFIVLTLSKLLSHLSFPRCLLVCTPACF